MWKGLKKLKTLRLTGNKLEIELQGFCNLPNIKIIIVGLPAFKTQNDILLSPSTYSDPNISPEVVIEDTDSLACDSKQLLAETAGEWASPPCRNFSNFFLKMTIPVISDHILALVSMKKYILNHN